MKRASQEVSSDLNSTNTTNNETVNFTNTNEILNPAKLAIKLQSILYLIEERIGPQQELKELNDLMATFQREKERLILIDKTNQGAVPVTITKKQPVFIQKGDEVKKDKKKKK